MLQVRVDGEPCAGVVTAGSFDDVLEMVEPALARRSRIVTAIRVNGVEEPAFREPLVRGRTLRAGDHVEVETASAEELATSALGDAVRLMPALCAATAQLSEQLRTSLALDAARELGPLAEGLTLLVTLVQAADAWADAAALARSDWLGSDVSAVARSIDALDEPQRAHDWVAVADVLAYDLAPALDAWRVHLETALAVLRSDGAEAHAAES